MLLRSPRFLALALLLLASAANAAIFIAPKDGELIDSADAIVIGTVTALNGEFIAGGQGDIATMIDIDVTQVLKGNFKPGDHVRVGELGGVVGSATMGVSSSPKYWRRNSALIFLQRTADGQWRTWGAALGKFDFVRDRLDRNLAVRWANEEDMSLWDHEGHPVEVGILRDADGFLDFIRTRVEQQQSPAPGRRRAAGPGVQMNKSDEEPDYFIHDVPMSEVTPPAYWKMGVDATGYPASAYSQGSFRWETFDQGGSVTFYVSGTQPGYDSTGAAQRGLAAWTNDPGSNINYVYGGTRNLAFVEDGTNGIVFNSATDVPAGAIAYSKWYGGAYHTYKGEQFISIFEGDVVVKSGINVTQKVFDEAVTHELGHTLGFRHSDQGTPSSTQAVMKAVLSGVYGATLGPWDVDAAGTVYSGPSAPTVTLPGAPGNLVATAISTSQVTITWSAATNATSYLLERSSNNGPFVQIAAIGGTSFTDGGLAANTTYLYRVRAANTGGNSAYSNVDHATTVIFLDDPLTRGTTAKDEHITQLRTAINALRVAVGLAPFSFTQAVGPGIVIRAAHILELRTALTPALNARGISPAYTPLGVGTVLQTVHIQELRNYVK